MTYFFCGVGGSGMSSLAQVLLARGYRVRGSDRSRDKGDSADKFATLQRLGIEFYPQDGSGVNERVNILVVSSAIEETIPDVQAARQNGIRIMRRAEVLAALFNDSHGIAVGGTSGKSTVTGMIGHILVECGYDPTIVNGAPMLNFSEGLGNARTGKGEPFVIEADESDGTIALFEPEIAVVNNITLDHKPVAELRPLFADFIRRAKVGAVVNLDDPEAAALASIHPHTVTFSLKDDPGFTLPVPGRHNLQNALAAIAAVSLIGVTRDEAVQALQSFKGISRRLAHVGTAGGVTVIDDFAHNPDKIAASLATLKESGERVIAIFQPHGFGPMKMMRHEIAEAFVAGMGRQDILLMPDIFYAGGSAQKDISSADLIADVAAGGRRAFHIPSRAGILDFLRTEMRAGDIIAVMGARDDTLTDFCRSIISVAAA